MREPQLSSMGPLHLSCTAAGLSGHPRSKCYEREEAGTSNPLKAEAQEVPDVTSTTLCW